MSGGKQNARRARPALEGLEDRKLLAASPADPSNSIFRSQNIVLPGNREIAYTTPEGTRVVVTIYGLGFLSGSERPDGSLNLRFSGTTFGSRIVSRVTGGTGHAALASLRDANTPSAASATSTGGEPLNSVNLRGFDLINGGAINLMGGVNDVYLRSIGPNTQIHLHDLTANVSTALRTPPALLTVTTTPGAGGTTTFGVSNTTLLNQTAAAPGVVFQVSGPMGGGNLNTPSLNDAQIFGYDPTASALIRFDAYNGAALQVIPVPGTGSPASGVGLGRDNGRLVALVSKGTTVFAFDAVTGALAGQFSTTGLAANGLNSIDDIGSTDLATYVVDSSAGPLGTAQAIDVTASLNSGVAVPVGNPFSPQREFQFAGGVTGIAGSDTIFASGAAHFDTFQPDLTQLGVISFSPAGGTPRETQRTAVPGTRTPFINTGPPGTILTQPIRALGSVDTLLALDFGVVNGSNLVNLYDPSKLTLQGNVSLADPNRLSGLSESFHPELAGAALLDVQGTLKRFFSPHTQDVVINDNGSANLVDIHQASDTTVVGRPLQHVNIPIRDNVQLISTAPRGLKGVSTRNGIKVQTTTVPFGPLSLPNG